VCAGRTALHRALAGGFHECAAVLLDANADIERPDAMKRTCLHCACLAPEVESSMKCLDLLFSRANDAMVEQINAKTKSDTTAIILATEKRAWEMVTLLLEKGADASIKNDEGKSALDLGKEFKAPKDVFGSAKAAKEPKKGFLFRRSSKEVPKEVRL
jgi:ankyrin repeat protein